MQNSPICESLGLSHLIIASTSTASYSPKIKVEMIGSKPSGSPMGFGRSPASPEGLQQNIGNRLNPNPVRAER